MSFQKSLADDLKKNLDSKTAWEVVGDFALYLENRRPGLYFFEDELPWQKADIKVALRVILFENLTDREVIELILTNSSILDFYIPSPIRYQELIEIKTGVDEFAANKATSL
ncbi:MAG: hypothetical protein WCO25_01290 [Candidatus Uhrbacteria bacterium]